MNTQNMPERKRARQKKIIMIYAARFVAVSVCTFVIILMICGFLYILEHLFHKEQIVYGEIRNAAEENGMPFMDAYAPEEKDVSLRSVYAGKIVVLDAGHGGKDEGTAYQNIKEKDIVLSIAEYLKEDLEKQGVTVIMTRETDTFLTLKERTEIANNSGAALYVSIHVDWYKDDSSVSGLTCHYYNGSADGANAAALMADSIQTGGISVRGTTGSDLYVLRNTTMPALLVETGFLSNSGDRNNLTQEAYQQKLSSAIADGVLNIIKQ